MFDNEIRERLLRADALLAEYQEVCRPVGEELRRRKEAATGNRYEFRFGCHEEGINTLCMHITDGADHPHFDSDSPRSPYTWEEAMRKQFFEGLKHVNLSGFF